MASCSFGHEHVPDGQHVGVVGPQRRLLDHQRTLQQRPAQVLTALRGGAEWVKDRARQAFRPAPYGSTLTTLAPCVMPADSQSDKSMNAVHTAAQALMGCTVVVQVPPGRAQQNVPIR